MLYQASLWVYLVTTLRYAAPVCIQLVADTLCRRAATCCQPRCPERESARLVWCTRPRSCFMSRLNAAVRELHNRRVRWHPRTHLPPERSLSPCQCSDGSFKATAGH